MRHTMRMLLVPEDFFESIAQTNDGTPVGLLRTRIQQIEQNKGMPGDEKDAKYNQEFKRLNKLVKEVEERPVDVRVQNAAPEPPAPQQAAAQQSPPKRRRKAARPAKVSTEDAEEYDTAASEPAAAPSIEPEKKRLRSASKQGTSSSSEPQSYSLTKHAMMEHVRKNETTLGVTEDGKILKADGTPYRTSNVDDIITYLLDRDKRSQFKNPPVGLREFSDRAKSIPILRRNLFPDQPHQFGKGGFTEYKKTACKRKFKPTIWF